VKSDVCSLPSHNCANPLQVSWKNGRVLTDREVVTVNPVYISDSMDCLFVCWLVGWCTIPNKIVAERHRGGSTLITGRVG
jgi:hypothetical protein